MPKRSIDTSTVFSCIPYEKLPARREIEKAQVDEVARDNPLTHTVEREPYFPDDKLKEAVDLAIALGRPLLLQGEPGCGKTRLAYAVAYALGLPLEENYIKSTSRAQDLLYSYDAVNRLYDAQLHKDATGKADPTKTDIHKYIRLGPLGRAIRRAEYGRRSVVLIDEIDKADLDFPNDLLLELDRLEFRVTEAPDMHYRAGDDPALRPIIFITHNEEKPLPTPFLRRCIFHTVKFPEKETALQDILAAQQVPNDAVSGKAIDILLKIRALELGKKPGLSELLDWVGYLHAVQTPADELDQLPYLGVLLKQELDQQRAREKLLPK